jgi:hypothetical protein
MQPPGGCFLASGGQGALFEKTAPWTVKHPQKLFISGCFNRHLSSVYCRLASPPQKLFIKKRKCYNLYDIFKLKMKVREFRGLKRRQYE